ncbi:MAG: sigma-54-dependent Fis family transcriptional regulator, partial [Leptospiraceae bacterium]|nr:sigma-54-dependent Fis family transcriptional regulator [Leptospiraceae bacterium]
FLLVLDSFFNWLWPGLRLLLIRNHVSAGRELLRHATYPGFVAGMLPVLVAATLRSCYPLLNPANLIPRLFLYISIAFAGSILILLPVYMYLAVYMDATLPVVFVYIGFLVLVLTVALILFLHFRYLRSAVPYLFFRDVYRKEQNLAGFLGDAQRLEDSRESCEALLEIILQNLYRVFHFEKGFILTVDYMGRRFLRFIGPHRPDFLDSLTQRESPFFRLRLSDEMIAELDRVFLLEDGFSAPFARINSAPGGRHRRIKRIIHDSVERFRAAGYSVFIPLIFKNECPAIIVLSARHGSRPYYNGELHLLERSRRIYAMTLRNQTLLGEAGRAMERNVSAAESFTTDFNRNGHMQIMPGNRALVYASEVFAAVIDKVRQLAGMMLPVLLQGETGTGKELVARFLHQEGPGNEAPFVAVNCSAIPAALWESELFGYRRGAFTDAKQDRKGLVEQAAGGTLFFDEIGEMPLEVQPKILRLIQERTFLPIGARGNVQADCRLVFATHRDLSACVRAGTFREDLFYRINVHPIGLPALRERTEDIPFIARYLMETGLREQNLQRANIQIEADALQALRRYPWPGNIRELENVLTQTLMQIGERNSIELPDLPAGIRAGVRPDEGGGTNDGSGQEAMVPERIARMGFEKLLSGYARELVQFALEQCAGNRTHAARMLGISRGKLLYQMKELGIKDES